MAFDIHTSVIREIELAMHNRADKAAFLSSKSFRIKVLTSMVDACWYSLGKDQYVDYYKEVIVVRTGSIH